MSGYIKPKSNQERPNNEYIVDKLPLRVIKNWIFPVKNENHREIIGFVDQNILRNLIYGNQRV